MKNLTGENHHTKYDGTISSPVKLIVKRGGGTGAPPLSRKETLQPDIRLNLFNDGLHSIQLGAEDCDMSSLSMRYLPLGSLATLQPKPQGNLGGKSEEYFRGIAFHAFISAR